MKNKYLLGIFILLTSILAGCDMGGLGDFDGAIIENSTKTNKFKQISFNINIVNSANEYLYVNQIDSIKLKVNGKAWGAYASEEIDTTTHTSQIENNVRFSNSKINYLVLAPYYINTTSLETAGDYLEYLNDRIVLTPGDYVCEVAELSFRDINNQVITIKPQIYKDFSVNTNASSAYAGEITIILDK